jgi:branched-subunit amino acid aminotransferase/4-amino-4-deoxychorismate lyase
MGVCNLFMVFKNKDDEIELVTPKLDGTILPGVTRDSVLKIASNMKNIKVSERNIFIDEFIEAFE